MCLQFIKTTMANDPKDRINLAALQQNDPYIERIVETAGQVALYNFNAETNEWEKTDVQGTMFIYTRSAAPMNGFIIMNRLSIHNFTEPITKEMEFQLNDPFLLYKNAESIHGIWFYNREQCGKVARTLEQLVHKSSVKASRPPKQRTKSLGDQSVLMSRHKDEQPGDGSIDIIQMLSKAQHEYNQTKSGTQKDPANAEGRNSESQVIRPIPMRGDSQLKGPKTPQEVGAMNVAQVKGQPHDSVPATGAPKFKRSTSMQETLPKDGQTEGSNVHGKSEQVPPLLQRLFSHSDASVVQPKSEGVKTVESLERLHLAEVEGRDLRKWETSTNADGKKPIDNLLQMLSHSEEQASSQRSPVTPQSLQGKLSKASGDLHSSHTSDSQLVAHEAPHRIALKGLNSSLMTPLNTLPEHTQSSGLSSIVQSRGSSGSGISSPHEVGAGGDPGAGLFTLEQFTDSSEGAVVPTSPQTIPASFTPSKLLTPSLIQKKPSSSGLLVPTAVTAKSEPPQAARVSPIPTLTKEQFKEAYIFMLQNDSEFVSRLYDAYLQVQSKPKT